MKNIKKPNSKTVKTAVVVGGLGLIALYALSQGAMSGGSGSDTVGGGGGGILSYPDTGQTPAAPTQPGVTNIYLPAAEPQTTQTTTTGGGTPTKKAATVTENINMKLADIGKAAPPLSQTSSTGDNSTGSKKGYKPPLVAALDKSAARSQTLGGYVSSVTSDIKTATSYVKKGLSGVFN
ncbi:MAG: hypothetical protein LBU81_02775 [Methanosarcinales archaeon]|jgi:hypothetical protein|nr:hypothetical protein [Methanosarcinales archaeon]